MPAVVIPPMREFGETMIRIVSIHLNGYLIAPPINQLLQFPLYTRLTVRVLYAQLAPLNINPRFLLNLVGNQISSGYREPSIEKFLVKCRGGRSADHNGFNNNKPERPYGTPN